MVQGIQKKGNPMWELYAEAGAGKVDVNTAITRLREYVHGLSPEEFNEWRTTAGDGARRVMSVAEAFSQAVVVLAAGQ